MPAPNPIQNLSPSLRLVQVLLGLQNPGGTQALGLKLDGPLQISTRAGTYRVRVGPEKVAPLQLGFGLRLHLYAQLKPNLLINLFGYINSNPT